MEEIKGTSIKDLEISEDAKNFTEEREPYELKFGMAKTTEDTIELLKAFVAGIVNNEDPTIKIYGDSPFYDRLKHLKKED